MLVGDTWMDARMVPAQRSWRASAAAVWRRRLGRIGGGARRVGGWVLGVESRGGTEKRSISSLPWVAGGEGPATAVSPERAMRLAAMWGSARILSTNLASVPVRQYRSVGDAQRGMPLASLFTKPSVQGTLHDWIQRAVMSMVLHGNAVGYITNRDYLGYPTQIEWLPRSWVQVLDTNPSGPGSYVNPIWMILGRQVPSEDIVHIPWIAVAGRVWGLSPMAAFATSVSTGLSAQEYTDTWFNSGGAPPGAFKNVNQVVDQKDAQVIKDRLVAAIRTRQPIVYGKDWEFDTIQLPASEVSFVETMRMTASQIAAIYGVPPELVGGETGGSMSYSSPQGREIELIQLTLLPWISKLEEHLSALLPRGQYVCFDADSLVRLDPVARWTMYEKQRLIGATNIDEIRDKEHMAPLPDGKGQDYTPLPIAAGASISPPAIRNEGEGRLRVVGDQ
ncbi:phage portal protein [Streptomyces sp. NPDC020983]|uniref:phage portal protein n=1 Tax=Streptomyces sp. NPDC020983 TaxID=3365106 RepID=UPI0037A900BF